MTDVIGSQGKLYIASERLLEYGQASYQTAS